MNESPATKSPTEPVDLQPVESDGVPVRDRTRVARYTAARRLLVETFRADAASPLKAFFVHWSLTILPIAAMLILCGIHPGAFMFTIAAIVTGFALNGLGLLMHEASHGFFHRDKRINDLVANLLVCLPIYNTVDGYRVPHFEHHRYLDSSRDPGAPLYRAYPNRAKLTALLLGDLFLYGAFAKFTDRYSEAETQPRASLGLGWGSALVAMQVALWALYTVVTGRWYAYFVIWLIPLAIMPQFINRIRTIVEHSDEPGESEVSRTTVPGWIEYLCVAPYGYAYHFEHHLAPTVPYYRLESAHRLLVERGFQFTDAELGEGYFRTFGRLFFSMEYGA